MTVFNNSKLTNTILFHMKTFAIGISILACSSCATVDSPVIGERTTFEPLGQSRAYIVSVATLFAQPTELEGKLVRIYGYLAAEWEGPIVFFTREHCQIYSSFDGIGISLAKDVEIRWNMFQKPDCRRVEVEGIYEAFSYKPPDAAVISLSSVRNVLQDVKYIADISEY